MEFMPWRDESGRRLEYLERALASAGAKGFAEQARAELALLQGSEAMRFLAEARWQLLAEVSLLAEISPGAWVDGVVDLLLHDPGREIVVVDWKTNRLLEGETSHALLERLRREYLPQLDAYRNGLRQLFPDTPIRVAIYAAAAGEWTLW
jgi:ATP-dependent exoDNAse (exonuclease V) beta subunit